MTSVPNGVYAIARPPDWLLTLQGGGPAPQAPVVILEPTGRRGEQTWQVEGLGNGHITLRNVRDGEYAGFAGEPESNRMLSGQSEPREWELRPSVQPRTFHVVVPGGPFGGRELALDDSPLAIYPPRAALRPLDLHNKRQAWTFQPHG